jgi:hypothetical protein
LRLVRRGLLIACLWVAAAPARAETTGTALAGVARARVVYLAGGTAYVDAGTAQGLREGDTLRVLRAGAYVAGLLARYVSARRAACDTLPGGAPLRLGDEASFRPHAAAETEAPAAPADLGAAIDSVTPVETRPAGTAARRVRGRIGARFLGVHSAGNDDLSQPGADLRLDAMNLAGGRADLAADVRTHRARFGHAAGPPTSHSRVYRLSASIHDPPGRTRLTLGRQSASTLANISLFDGALAQYAAAGWRAGVFAGSQPDPVTLGFSTRVVEGGGFVELHQSAPSSRRWSVAVGGVTSYEGGQVSRDFVFVQGGIIDDRVALAVTQELDVNTGWKLDAGEPAIAPTSTYVSAQARLRRSLAVRAGYDNRRAVRLHRDRLTPETEFDDSYRQGAWTGVSLELGAHARLDGEARLHRRPGDDGHAFTLAAEGRRLTRLHAAPRLRVSTFESNQTRSRIQAIGLAVDPTAWSHVDVSGGTRFTSDDGGPEERTPWQSMDLELALPGRWFLSVSTEWTHDPAGDSRQDFALLSLSF